MWIFHNILSFIFPPACFICHKKDTPLCTVCVKNLPRTIQVLPSWIHSTYTYKNKQVKRCLHQIKYYNRPDLIYPLVSEACNEELVHFVDKTEHTVLVPIPMHRMRRWSRGYNHAERLAKSYSAILGIPVNTTLLTRTTLTKQQAKTKHRKERRENIQGTFSIQKNIPRDPTTKIILIDDTTTTNATLLEAKKVLEHAGYNNVHAITLAH